MWVGIGVGIGRNRFATGIFNDYALRVTADGGITEAGQCVDAVTGLLLNASLLLIPSGYKSTKLYSEIPTNGNGDLTWTRTSTAIRTNSSGLLESMGSGVPRLSYMYGSCPSALLEPQRTNLGTWSDDFSNAVWGKTWVTITSNTTTSPDGLTNADTLTADGTSNNHRVELSGSVTSGTVYTVSIYAKKNSNDFLQIFGFGSPFGVNVWANFNLNTGIVGSVGSSTTASIQSVGNGWYRCIITGTAATTGSFALIGYSIVSSATSTRAESNTLSTSVYLFGAQLEAGAYPTTYIPTTSASATRVADTFSRSNIYTNGLISASGGTWFVEFRNNIAYTRDASSVGLSLDSSTFINGLMFRNTGATDRLIIQKYVAGSGSTLYTTTTNTTKIAIKWNGTTADIFENGTKVVSATSFTPTTLENLGLSSGQVPYFIQQMALFNSPLTDAQCQTLTTL